MKTSNKVLFGGLTLIFVTTILLAVMGRATARVQTKVDCDGAPKIVKELDFTFESISVSENIEVRLTYGDEFKVQLETSEEIAPIVNHHVEDGTLELDIENYKHASCAVLFRIQCPSLKYVSAVNGARVISNGTFSDPEMQLKVSNGSSMDLDVVSEQMSMSAQNGSSISIRGRVYNLDVSASNSSSINATKADVRNSTLNIVNSSSAVIKTDTISTANVTNSSSLQYIGETQLQDVRSVNSSSISKREE